MMLPDPCPAITRAACLMPASTARKCTAMIASNCSRSTSANAAYCDDLPALLTRQSSRPKRSTACAIIRSTSASTVTSVRMKLPLSPRVRASLSPRSRRRSAITTLAPSLTKISAVRAPMPLAAPVTTATLPASIVMSGPRYRLAPLVGGFNHANRSSNGDFRSIRGDDFHETATPRRGHFHVGLVGLNGVQRLALRESITGLLEPLGDPCPLHVHAHPRHSKRYFHAASPPGPR